MIFTATRPLNHKITWKWISVSQKMKSAPVLIVATCLLRSGFIFTTNISGNLSVRICSLTCK